MLNQQMKLEVLMADHTITELIKDKIRKELYSSDSEDLYMDKMTEQLEFKYKIYHRNISILYYLYRKKYIDKIEFQTNVKYSDCEYYIYSCPKDIISKLISQTG